MSSVGGGSDDLGVSKVSLGTLRPRPPQVKQRAGQAPISAARIDSDADLLGQPRLSAENSGVVFIV